MSSRTPSDLPDVGRFRNWKPDAQARALQLLKERENEPWRPFYCKNPRCNGQPHVWPADQRECPRPFGHEWDRTEIEGVWACQHCEVGGALLDEWDFPHAREDQRPPRWHDDWLTLLLSGGRGSGKTRTGSEITNRVTAKVPRVILIGSTGPDLRETMVEGRSGILATAPPGKRPTWEPSKKKLTWPNGCIGQGFSAEEPDRLRGPESAFIWGDEPAHWEDPEAVWDNMQFGLRIPGFPPKIVATSTPLPTKWMKKLIAQEDTIRRVVSTYANVSNLAPTFRRMILNKYEGTRTGRQELHGELLGDVEGALWNWDIIHSVEDAPALRRILVSVDPAGTANKRSDETGIIVLAEGVDGNIYVLADLTGKYSPDGWGRACWKAAEEFHADAIVYEKNYGGEMVKTVLDSTRPKHFDARLIPVTSRRGKEVRAEPIVGLYEQRRVFHVGMRGDLEKLEEEQTTWVPRQGPSPNRIDALVHGATELRITVSHSSIASPAHLTRRAPTNRHLRAV